MGGSSYKRSKKNSKMVLNFCNKMDYRCVIARRDIEDIFETVRFSRIPKTSFNNIASIIIGVAYGTGVFGNANNIEVVYQLAYQKVIKDENYLELSEEETVTQLLSYIENIPYLRLLSKGKGKNTGDITLLVVPTGTAGLVSLILPSHTQQIILPEF